MSTFHDNHLSEILAFFESALPGEMPNALMDQLTRYLQKNGKIHKSVNLKPDSSNYIHEYGSDSESDDSESESESSDSDSDSGIEALSSGLSSCYLTPPGEQCLIKDSSTTKTKSKDKSKDKAKDKAKSKHKQCKGLVAGTGERCHFKATKGHYCGHHKK